MNTQVIERTEFEAVEHAPVHEGVPSAGFVGLVRRVLDNIQDWHRYRSAVRELSLLEDARLTDIGIVRSEIRNVVRHAMQEKKKRAARGSEPMQKAA